MNKELIPGKLYSFQNMLCPEEEPVIGTFIVKKNGDYTITVYKILVGSAIRTVDLFMYEVTEL